MNNKDYYKTLGLSKSATQAEIKRAYRKLAHEYHPDKGGDKKNEAKFKEVSEAYSVLGDESKRKQFDQFGFAPGPGSGGEGARNWQDYSNVNINFEDMGFSGFGDVFETFFGGGRSSSRGRQKRGADLQVKMIINLKEVLEGTEPEINLNKWTECSKCKGEGNETGSSLKTCSTCRGQGQISKATQTIFGTFSQAQICPECEGSGKVPEKKCFKCRGAGRIKETEHIHVKIPAGVSSGTIIKVKGKGEAAGRGGVAGDLYLNIFVKEDPVFVRDGINLLTEISIPFKDAILGSVAKAPTINGSIDFKISAGTQPGQVIKLSGKGLPNLNGNRMGDILVKINVEIPRKISASQKKLLEEWDQKKSWFL